MMGARKRTVIPELVPSTPRRRRFTVFHLYLGSLCQSENQSAEQVQSILAHRQSIPGWKNRDRFEAKLVGFLNDAQRGNTMMVADLAAIVRER